ncbi:MAG TPA: TetR family transcriptional regulator [Acidimicrobiia bacterium]
MTARGDETRNRLLDVAEQMFGDRGVNGVSLREIRLASGARNTAAIQFHFGDREGLVHALTARHMPRIAELQQERYDVMVREGRQDDSRSLVEVLVRPSADYLLLGPSERAWVKIMGDLGAEPALEPNEMALLAPEPALRVSRRLYERLSTSVPEDIALERMVVLAQFAVHLCADRARLEDAPGDRRTHAPRELFVENLTDMVTGALFAPVGPRGVLHPG